MSEAKKEIQIKKWYLSKTIWSNLVMGVLVLAMPKLGVVITEDVLAGVFMIVNIILRTVTKDKLELK